MPVLRISRLRLSDVRSCRPARTKSSGKLASATNVAPAGSGTGTASSRRLLTACGNADHAQARQIGRVDRRGDEGAVEVRALAVRDRAKRKDGAIVGQQQAERDPRRLPA